MSYIGKVIVYGKSLAGLQLWSPKRSRFILLIHGPATCRDAFTNHHHPFNANSSLQNSGLNERTDQLICNSQPILIIIYMGCDESGVLESRTKTWDELGCGEAVVIDRLGSSLRRVHYRQFGGWVVSEWANYCEYWVWSFIISIDHSCLPAFVLHHCLFSQSVFQPVSLSVTLCLCPSLCLL